MSTKQIYLQVQLKETGLKNFMVWAYEHEEKWTMLRVQIGGEGQLANFQV